VRTLWSGVHETAYGGLRIVFVKTVPEPVGAFWKFAMLDRADPDIERAAYTTLDFGYFTTGALTVRRMAIDHTQTWSMNFGAAQVFHRLADLWRTHYGRTTDPFELEQAVLGRWALPAVTRSGPPLAHLLDATLDEVGPALIERVRSVATRASSALLLTGGGVALFGARVAAAFPDRVVMTVAEPQAANAKGFWRLACDLDQAGVAHRCASS